MRLTQISFSLLVGIATLSACGDDATNNNGNPDSGVTADLGTIDQGTPGDAAVESDAAVSTVTVADFCTRLGALREEFAIECCSDTTVREWFQGEGAGVLAADSEAECLSTLSGNAFEMDKARFDSARAATVLATLEANVDSCPTDVEAATIGHVSALIIGQIPLNGNCRAAFEDEDYSMYFACVSGTTCISHYDETTEETTYTCDTFIANGATCDTDEGVDGLCGPDSFCPARESSQPPTSCAPKKALGASCTYDFECVSEFCIGEENTDPVCVERTADELYCPAVG